MKQQLLFAAALVAAIAVLVTAAQAQETEIVKTAPFEDCANTRLGCLDKKPLPSFEVPAIAIGLKLQINCQATDVKGQEYSINVKHIKNISVQEGSLINIYLSAGPQGLLQYSVKKTDSALLEFDTAAGYFLQSTGTQNLEAGSSTIKLNAYGTKATRVGHYENTSELVFSDISVSNVANSFAPQLKIHSVFHKSIFYNDISGTIKETITEIQFQNSNCAYN